MVKKDNEKKQEILKLMKNNEWFTTTEIRDKLILHFYKVELLMSQLLAENKVEKSVRKTYVFWRLKNAK